MGSVVTVCSWIYRGQEIRYSHARVQHAKQISRGDSLPLGDSQQFDDGTFYNFSARLYGLSSINHGSRCKGLYLNKIAGPNEFLNVSLRVRSKLRNQVFESRTIRQDGPCVRKDRHH
jgi:hypothetical protein